MNTVAGDGHDALDEILSGVAGIYARVLENDDLPSLRCPPCEKFDIRERYFEPVDEFVHEDVIADEERGEHGACRYFESLDEEGADDERDDDRIHEGFDVLTGDALAGIPHMLFRELVVSVVGFEQLFMDTSPVLNRTSRFRAAVRLLSVAPEFRERSSAGISGPAASIP